ncbi:hypothetical protein D3C81_1617350 [compost metagenome]
MLRRDQPIDHRRRQGGAFAGFGKGLLVGQEAIVLLGHGQWPLKVEDAPIEGGRPRIAKYPPHFIQHEMALVARHAAAIGTVEQAPAQPPRLVGRQVAEHPISWLATAAQALGGIEVTANAAALLRNIDEQFQRLALQARQAGLRPLERPAPDAAQGVAQLLGRRIGQFHDRLAGGFREFLSGELTLDIQRPRHRNARQCHARDEASPRNRH